MQRVINGWSSGKWFPWCLQYLFRFLKSNITLCYDAVIVHSTEYNVSSEFNVIIMKLDLHKWLWSLHGWNSFSACVKQWLTAQCIRRSTRETCICRTEAAMAPSGSSVDTHEWQGIQNTISLILNTVEWSFGVSRKQSLAPNPQKVAVTVDAHKAICADQESISRSLEPSDFHTKTWTLTFKVQSYGR